MVFKLPGAISRRYHAKIRDKAIERAKARIYANGKTPEELSELALETIVKDEEDKIKSDLKTKGIYILVAALGLSFWT